MVRDASSQSVADCEFLGLIQGSSGWGNKAANVGVQNAMNEVREKAAERGATHIVWKAADGTFASVAEGEAFKCPRGG
jgi:hypothetical protein